MIGSAGSLIVAAAALSLVALAGPPAPAASTSQPASEPTSQPTSQPATQPDDATIRPGTAAMIRRLEQSADEVSIPANVYANEARVIAFRAALAAAEDDRAQRVAQFQLALELLRAGRPEEAIPLFEDVLDRVRTSERTMPRNVATATRYLALAYLRLGEQMNCLQRHATDSCLFPIRGSGVHVDQQGSRAAEDLYASLLREQPNDLASRWLLNIAAMTLGDYPDGVPEAWRIDPSAFASQDRMPRFYDIAPALGIAEFGLAGGAATEDFDGDGYIDIMCSSWGPRDQLKLFRNQGDGTFRDQTAEAGLLGITGGLNLIHADYDNDGAPDVLVLRGAWCGELGRVPNSLLRNLGDGTFEDVTDAAGVLSFFPTQTAVWADFDRDGQLDLFIGNESSPPLRHPCELYRNNGDGSFSECAASAGVAHLGYVKGVVAGDVDGDRWPDLYLSCDGEPNVLFRNLGASADGGIRFRDDTAFAGVRQPIESFPTWFFDADNDGDLDLFVAGYGIDSVGDVAAYYLGIPHRAALPRLYLNEGDGSFLDVTASAGLAAVTMPMGANFGDLDNDGYLDFYLGTGEPAMQSIMPNLMFRNDGSGHFRDVTVAGGFGHLQKGHGVAFADLDNDGDQDLYCVIGGAFTGDRAFNVLFENPGNENHWLTLVLEGVRSNRSAIGAAVTVTVEDDRGQRNICRTVGTGGSFGSSSLDLEIGLGGATRVIAARVLWPSGAEQVFAGLTMDRVYKLREGDPAAVLIERKRLSFQSNEVPQNHHDHQ